MTGVELVRRIHRGVGSLRLVDGTSSVDSTTVRMVLDDLRLLLAKADAAPWTGLLDMEFTEAEVAL